MQSFRAIGLLLVAWTSLLGADCAIDGSVVNAVSGEPVSRARVAVNNAAIAADNSGRWSLRDAPCGTVRVTAQRAGFISPPAPSVLLVAGQPRMGFKLELTPQAVITGRILDDQGDPVMGAQVMVFTGRIVDGLFAFRSTTGAQTNDLGEFRIPGLQKGRYIVCSGGQCYPGSPDGGRSNAMDLQPGGQNSVNITAISDAHSVHVKGAIGGLPAGRGLAVSLAPQANGGVGIRPLTSGVRPDGKFDIAGVTPGAYLLVADYFDSGKRMSSRVPVTVGSSDIEGLVVQLETPGTIHGTVGAGAVSGTGRPAPQFGINFRALDPRMASSGPAKWDADHRSFTLSDVMPGVYRLDIVPPVPFYVRSASVGGVDAMKGDVSVNRATSTLEIILSDDGGSITGDITNEGGEAVASGILLVPAKGRPRIVNTPANGHFSIANMAPGDYTVSAWDHIQDVEYGNPDWMRRYAKETAVTVTAGQQSQVSLRQLAAPPL